MKRHAPPPKGKQGSWSCPDPDFGKRFPTIAAFLCDCWWDDGKPRDVGSLSVRMSDDNLTISLVDPENKASCFTTAETLTEAFTLLEAALASGRAVWRRWKK